MAENYNHMASFDKWVDFIRRKVTQQYLPYIEGPVYCLNGKHIAGLYVDILLTLHRLELIIFRRFRAYGFHPCDGFIWQSGIRGIAFLYKRIFVEIRFSSPALIAEKRSSAFFTQIKYNCIMQKKQGWGSRCTETMQRSIPQDTPFLSAATIRIFLISDLGKQRAALCRIFASTSCGIAARVFCSTTAAI